MFLFTGSPDRVSTLSSPGTRPGIRPVIRDRQPGGASHHVPVSCCLSAAGIRFSVIRFPPRDRLSSRSAYRPTAGPRRGYRVPHARAATGVGALSTPGTTVLIPTEDRPQPALCRSTAASPYTPLQIPSSRGPHYEASTRVQAIHPSGLPLACSPRMERASLGFPPSFEPRRPGAGRRTSGWGQAMSTGLEQRTRHQPNLQSSVSTHDVRPRVAPDARRKCSDRICSRVLPTRSPSLKRTSS